MFQLVDTPVPDCQEDWPVGRTSRHKACCIVLVYRVTYMYTAAPSPADISWHEVRGL